MARHAQSEKRREGISNDESRISRVKERNLTGSVTWRGNHPQGADKIMLTYSSVNLRLTAWKIAAADLGLWLIRVERKIPLIKTAFSNGNHNLGVREFLSEAVQRANMITVRMRQYNSIHRVARFCGEFQDEAIDASIASIDEGKTILLPNQVTVDSTPLGKLNEMLVYCRDSHPGTKVTEPAIAAKWFAF